MLIKKAEVYLKVLCEDISNRSVGAKGNLEATDYIEKIFRELGWKTDTPEFNAIDWETSGAIQDVTHTQG